VIRRPRLGGSVFARALLVMATSAVTPVACGTTSGTTPGGGGDGVEAGAGATPCPSAHGPKMVRVAKRSSGSFCIDSTEVTRDDYSAFLQEVPAGSMKSSLPVCAKDTDPTPDATCVADPRVCKGDACGRHPQVCVGLCEAAAYCEWAGKRLCGALAGGGAIPSADLGNPEKEEWGFACALGFERALPYGDGKTFNAETCNIGLRSETGCLGSGRCTTLPVASLPDCQGSVPGVFDLGGNVSEWVNFVGDGVPGFEEVFTRGASFRETGLEGVKPPAFMACNATQRGTLSARVDEETGIRCCAD
jgi:formylglycine-generating enzyme